MAPKRKSTELEALIADEGVTGTGVELTVEVAPLRRVTRSLTQGDAVPPPHPKRKAAYKGKKRGRKPKTTPEPPKTTTEEAEEEEVPQEVEDGAKALVKKRGKRVKTTPDMDETTAEEKDSEEEKDGDGSEAIAADEKEASDDNDADVAAGDVKKVEAGSGSAPGSESSSQPTVIIERCTQCKSFSDRARQVQAGLEEALPGINVLINPDKKPRKGCFEIRVQGDIEEPVVSLLDMKRPFKKMKNLDMEEVVADIIKRIQS